MTYNIKTDKGYVALSFDSSRYTFVADQNEAVELDYHQITAFVEEVQLNDYSVHKYTGLAKSDDIRVKALKTSVIPDNNKLTFRLDYPVAALMLWQADIEPVSEVIRKDCWKLYEYEGQFYTVDELAAIVGIKSDSMRWRIKKYGVEKAMTLKKQSTRSYKQPFHV